MFLTILTISNHFPKTALNDCILEMQCFFHEEAIKSHILYTLNHET